MAHSAAPLLGAALRGARGSGNGSGSSSSGGGRQAQVRRVAFGRCAVRRARQLQLQRRSAGAGEARIGWALGAALRGARGSGGSSSGGRQARMGRVEAGRWALCCEAWRGREGMA